jgi:DNA repair exonuclease SbcCD ATPase subunit
MKIIELKSSNIKRIKAVELHLDEKQNLVLITGKNAAGKSSILDSIWYALGGKKAVQDKPIREGEEKGEIEVDVNGYLVKRTFTGKSSYLQVTNKDGSKYSNPQEFLDYIIGNLSFDPLEFSRMDEKKQIAELTKIVGLDLTPLDEKKKKLTEDRLLVGREIKTMAKYEPEIIAECQKASQATLVSVADLSKKLEEEIAKHNKFVNAQNFITRLKLDNENLLHHIAQIQESIKSNEKQIIEQAEIKDSEVNIDELKLKIESAEDNNNNIRNANSVLKDDTAYKAKDAEYRKLTEDIRAVEEEKAKKLAAVKMPIDGLSWDEEKVLYKGIPFIQGSAAEQLRVSMAIAMASNPKLKVILIRDGSLLDADNLKVIEEMARDKDFQVWIERVDDSGKIGIYIEDGEVKSINE